MQDALQVRPELARGFTIAVGCASPFPRESAMYSLGHLLLE